jgi:hypothetical protein
VGTLVSAADAQSSVRRDLRRHRRPDGTKGTAGIDGRAFRGPLVGFDDAPGRGSRSWKRGRPLEELDFSGPTTFVLGAEREGLPEEVLLRCEERATIPLAAGADSLNVALAGAIALYELWRRRRESSGS